MTVSAAVAALRSLPSSQLCGGRPATDLRNALRADDSVQLPESHVELLSLANGIMTFHGYYRLFGVACDPCIDLVRWNERETWKFAWEPDLDRYLAFGETAWGDQYAYQLEELQAGKPNVYVLDAFEMVPEPIAASFEEFLENELVRCSRSPYDQLTIDAFRRIGALDWSDHITYIPSLLLGGEERSENVHRINGRASMIVNGDLDREMKKGQGTVVDSIATYTDAQGRLRTRIVWAC